MGHGMLKQIVGEVAFGNMSIRGCVKGLCW